MTLTATSAASTTQNTVAAFFVMRPPAITTTDLPRATPGSIYNTTLQATGGVQPFNWTIASGALPAGLHLNSAGEIFGTPTTGGPSSFTVKVTDSSGAPGGTLSTQQTLSLTVIGILTIPAGALPTGTVGIAYSATLPYAGGTLPLSWTIYSGSLPSGVVLQQSTGLISGTPTFLGSFSFAVTVFDSCPTLQTYSKHPLP